MNFTGTKFGYPPRFAIDIGNFEALKYCPQFYPPFKKLYPPGWVNHYNILQS